jgi:fumarate hydratase class II
MRNASANKTSLTRKANAAMRDAVAKVVQDHRQRHMPLAIWQDGRVVRIQPDQTSVVRERPADYKTRRRR